MNSKKYNSLITCLLMIAPWIFSANQAKAESIYVSLNVEPNVSREFNNYLYNNYFFYAESKLRPHISVVELEVSRNAISNIKTFIAEQLRASLKKHKSKPLFFYADQISLVSSAKEDSENLKKAYVVVENSYLPHSEITGFRHVQKNDNLTSCILEDKKEHQAFVSFTENLETMLKGKDQSAFTSVAFKKHVGITQLANTFPHVTVDRVENVDVNGSKMDQVKDKMDLFVDPAVRPHCEDYFRYQVTGYFIRWTVGKQVYSERVDLNDL